MQQNTTFSPMTLFPKVANYDVKSSNEGAIVSQDNMPLMLEYRPKDQMLPADSVFSHLLCHMVMLVYLYVCRLYV